MEIELRDPLPTAAQAAQQAIIGIPERIVGLIRAWSLAKDYYADLRSRARTDAAHQLVARLRHDIEGLEREAFKRVRKRREISGAKFSEAIERFVGDLLRARADTTLPALIYRPIGKTSFDDAPVKYDMFMSALEGLKGLELVAQRLGKPRYRRTAFGPDVVSVSLKGHASRFWATGKLIKLAALFGIDSSTVQTHFAPGPPEHPLVLKDYGVGRGRNRESARRVS